MTCYKNPYLTSQGERWTDIALAFYGNAMRTAPLAEANPELADYLIFPMGLEVRVPILDQERPDSLPPWKRGG